MEIQQILKATEEAVKACDDAHFPNLLRLVDKLEKNYNRPGRDVGEVAADGCLICYIRLEEKRRANLNKE